MQTHEFCEICGHSYPPGELSYFDDSLLCDDCLDERTVFCIRCGDRILNEDNAGNDDMPLCQDCFDRCYVICTSCGRIIHEDDSYVIGRAFYCDSCYRNTRAIRDYYYKPAPIFYGKGSRFFGVELELDEGGEDVENARELLDIANRTDELIYCKHDGSIQSGFEIVTHPMTLGFHLEQMPWADILDAAIAMGYRSHQTQTCGLHIHVNRTSFGYTGTVQDVGIARVLFFFEKHWEELLKFSRRTPQQLEHWAARYGYKDRPCEILDHAKRGYHGGRYSCVNLQNADTIEFRIFRGTLKLNTVIATIQLVNRICDLASIMSDTDMQNLSWTTFAAGCREPELVQYLKERQLYINEPVETAEEV